MISEGMGEARLRESAARAALPNLRLLPFQPIDHYPDVLGAADVLVALLEPTAGTFVPSKVLSYLCAGRPSWPHPAREPGGPHHRAGGRRLVVSPTDEEAFLVAAKQLLVDGHHAHGGGPERPRLR